MDLCEDEGSWRPPVYWRVVGNNCEFCNYCPPERRIGHRLTKEFFWRKKYLPLLVSPLDNQNESKCGRVQYSEIGMVKTFHSKI